MTTGHSIFGVVRISDNIVDITTPELTCTSCKSFKSTPTKLQYGYYNLEKDFDYIVVESSVSDVPENMPLVVVLPSTIPDLLAGCEDIDIGRIPYCNFVGVDLNDLQEVHVSSGVVMCTVGKELVCEFFPYNYFGRITLC